MWRERHNGDWAASAAELSRDLATLHLPHETVVAFRRPGPARCIAARARRSASRCRAQAVLCALAPTADRRTPRRRARLHLCVLRAAVDRHGDDGAVLPRRGVAGLEGQTGQGNGPDVRRVPLRPAYARRRAAARLQHPRPAGPPTPGVRGLLRQWTGRAEAPDRPACWRSGAYGRPITPLSTPCRRKRAGAQNRGRRQLPATTASLARTARSHTPSCGSRLTPPGHPAVLGPRLRCQNA